MKHILIVALVFMLATSIGTAQLKEGAFGIQAGVLGGSALYSNSQGVSVGSTSLTGLYNVNQTLRVGFSVGFASVSPSSGSSTSDFEIGIGVDSYLSSSDHVSTLVGVRLGYLSYTPGYGTSISGVDIGLKAGAEYAFSSRFSIQAFVGLDYRNGGPSGETTSQFGTLSGTALSFYF
ncbi:MAG: hypothetical protein WAV76_06580 [Bacteroidota bacterium]